MQTGTQAGLYIAVVFGLSLWLCQLIVRSDKTTNDYPLMVKVVIGLIFAVGVLSGLFLASQRPYLSGLFCLLIELAIAIKERLFPGSEKRLIEGG